jgi:hypothetical protein
LSESGSLCWFKERRKQALLVVPSAVLLENEWHATMQVDAMRMEKTFREFMWIRVRYEAEIFLN